MIWLTDTYFYNKNEITGILGRLPENQQLDVNKTFENQRKLVNNTLIPVIQKTINKKTFPASDAVIKHIIHERHRHQRENFLNSNRDDDWNNKDKRRKHANSRHNEVSKNRLVCFLFLTF